MRFVLDACVLFPNVMRSALLAVAETGAYEPIWSPRLLEEWRRAGHRHGPDVGVAAEAEIALLALRFPKARRATPENLERFYLPDENDIHVLALAVAESADGIITVNRKDFPRHILAEEGLSRADPDAFLVGAAQANPGPISLALRRVAEDGQAGQDPRGFFKKARLPRLAKWLVQQT